MNAGYGPVTASEAERLVGTGYGNLGSGTFGLSGDLGGGLLIVNSTGGAFGGGPLSVSGADPLDLAGGKVLLADGRTRSYSVSIGGETDSLIDVSHRGTLAFDDPRVTMQWGAVAPSGFVKPLATEPIDGGTRYHYTNGYVDDFVEIGRARFTPQQLSTSLELLPNAVDAMRDRYGLLAAIGGSSTEQIEIADYFARFGDAMAAGDLPTMQAALASDVKALQGGNIGLANRIIGLGSMIDPEGAWAKIPRLDRSLTEFAVTSATGLLGMFTGGWTFGAAGRAGMGMLRAGAISGVVGDATIQAADNVVFAATGGNYGRSGINGVELGLATGLGALPGAAGAVRSLAEDVRALGLPDWRIAMARQSPSVLYSNPLPFELQRILPAGLRGDSRVLGINLGGSIEGYANHHLIMTSAAQDSIALRSLAERGLYDVNRASNGLQLPTNEYLALADRLPLHTGFHGAEYRLAVEGHLTRLDEAFRLGASDAQLLARVSRMERSLSNDLISGRVWLNDADAALRRLGRFGQ